MKPALPIVLLFGQAGVGKDSSANCIKELYGEENVFVTANALPLKMLVKSIFGFSDEQLFGPSEMRNHVDVAYSAASKWGRQWYVPLGAPYLVNSQIALSLYTWAKTNVEAPDDMIVGLANKASDILFRYSLEAGGLSPRVVLQTVGTEFGRELDRNVWIRQSIGASIKALETDKALAVITDGRFRNEVVAIRRAGAVVLKINGTTTVTSQHASETEVNQVPQSLIDYNVLNEKTGFEELKRQLDVVCYPIISARFIP